MLHSLKCMNNNLDPEQSQTINEVREYVKLRDKIESSGILDRSYIYYCRLVFGNLIKLFCRV